MNDGRLDLIGRRVECIMPTVPISNWKDPTSFIDRHCLELSKFVVPWARYQDDRDDVAFAALDAILNRRHLRFLDVIAAQPMLTAQQ